ncbi:MAG: TolC family protein [Sediminibacterium sp.]|nr:TolC family protein [Sediminibacterium sp.]
MIRIISSLFLIICLTKSIAQPNNAVVFSPQQFIEQVRQYHPVARQARIVVQKADAELLAAKGLFDPTAQLNAERKTFDGKNYFFYTNPEVKLPTWIGADFKAGLENNGGQFLNPEVTRSQSSYLGFEMPLARGLVMDKRRAAVEQARLFRSQSDQERLGIINDLLFDSYVTYWEWAGAYQLYSIYSRFLEISRDRLRFVRIAFFNGDRSVMDTVEALTQVQNFEMLQANAQMRFNNTRLELSNFLWEERDSAFIIPTNYVPDTTQFVMYQLADQLDNYVSRANQENPFLRMYDFKLDALEVERKLKFQSLLPYLNVKYNLLNQGYNVFRNFDAAALFTNNYKWGIDFKIPLFLREGRGDYRKAKLKIQETNLEVSNKRWQIENKVRFYYNEMTLLEKQLRITQQALNNYQILLRNETLRFENGESSLFLVNTRENKVMESMEKLVELRIKYYKSRYATEWAAGILR